MSSNSIRFFHKRTLPLSALILALAACQTVNEPEPAAVVVESAPVTAPPLREVRQPVTARPQPQRPAPAETPAPVPYQDLWVRLADGMSLYQRYSHPDIDAALAAYLEYPPYFERIARRAEPFLYLIVEEVESRGFPLEIALLPVIESAFDPNAYSAENAVGLWQLIEPTAVSLGLQSDWWYDGRRDPLASTGAALDYLEFLYEEFDNDWLLTLAAYNAGEGNVRRALRRANEAPDTEVDFWALGLPAETRNHVPRLLAIARLIANAADYDIEFPVLPNAPYLAVAEPDFQLDIAIAASLAGVDEDTLRELNPGYLQWATHPDHPQSILLPRENLAVFRQAVSELPARQGISWDRYEIRQGDTLSGIARRYNTRVDVLRRINDLNGSLIIAGRSLLIPRTDSVTVLPRGALGSLASREPIPTIYRVRRGDTLWDIARRFDLAVGDLVIWNDLDPGALIFPGQVLELVSTGTDLN